MQRLVTIFVLCIAVYGLVGKSVAQPAEGTATILAQNPSAAALAKVVDAATLRRFILQLDPIPPARDRSKGELRGGAPATGAELAQIAANPAFANRYNHDPNGTLILLRWVNDTIRKAGHI